MPHPQDVAVPSLPRAAVDEHNLQGGRLLYTADQMRAYARAAVIADRAAGRASAEPVSINQSILDERAAKLTQGRALGERIGLLAAAPTPTASIAPKGEGEAMVYVEARQCENCLHAGLNDEHATESCCNACHWHGLSAKDHCPECHQDGTMCAACPECGGLYTLVAGGDVRGAAPVAQAAAGALSFDDWWYGHDGVRQRQVAYLGWPCTKELAKSIYEAALSPPPEADADRASGGGV